MGSIFDRVNLYAMQHKKIPSSLDILPKRKGYWDTSKDGWDRDIIIEIKDDKIIILTSYGDDGKPGGTEEDADIIRSHWLRKPDGSLWAGHEDWYFDSMIHNK